MPYNPPSDGDVLTATLLLDDVWDQVIAQVTSASRPTGTEGQVIYETDTGRFYAHDGSGFVQFGGIASSATNTHTPQIDQGATTNIAKTTTYSQYQRFGNLCWWSFSLTVTGAGTLANIVTVTTPVTMTSTSASAGAGHITDASATTGYTGMWFPASTTTLRLYVDTATTAAWGQSPSIALANGDTIRGAVWLPVA